MTCFKTLIVDDSQVFRTWLGNTLSETVDFDIIGQASTGADAIALALEIKPDLLIADFFLPDMDGLEIHDCLLAKLPCIKVIIISAHDTEVRAVLETSNQSASFLPKVGLSAAALRNLLPGAEGP